MPKSDVQSLDFVVTRFLMKLFRTVNHDDVTVVSFYSSRCQVIFLRRSAINLSCGIEITVICIDILGLSLTVFFILSLLVKCLVKFSATSFSLVKKDFQYFQVKKSCNAM